MNYAALMPVALVREGIQQPTKLIGAAFVSNPGAKSGCSVAQLHGSQRGIEKSVCAPQIDASPHEVQDRLNKISMHLISPVDPVQSFIDRIAEIGFRCLSRGEEHHRRHGVLVHGIHRVAADDFSV